YLDDHQAVSLGLKVQADVVIIGTSVAERTPNIMGQNIRSFKGVVSARAIRTHLKGSYPHVQFGQIHGKKSPPQCSAL
ncbi:MAG: hypothetical protein JRF45_14120, partial [Deltaproteobacteria bacterium]|nr:hypothetical protein [Deltaproteobacteria bacterium]